MPISLPRTRAVFLFLLLLTGTASVAGCTQEQSSTWLPDMAPDEEPDVPFVESPQFVVDKMLELANVTRDDVVYDLGSGDGRIPITAAKKYGARAVGIEIKPDLVEKARANAEEAGVSNLVEFRQGDLFEADLSEATVVTLYLLPSVNMKLRPTLFRELEPGDRVVSHDFDMEHWRPDTTWKSEGASVHRWTISEDPPPFVKVDP